MAKRRGDIEASKKAVVPIDTIDLTLAATAASNEQATSPTKKELDEVTVICKE